MSRCGRDVGTDADRICARPVCSDRVGADLHVQLPLSTDFQGCRRIGSDKLVRDSQMLKARGYALELAAQLVLPLAHRGQLLADGPAGTPVGSVHPGTREQRRPWRLEFTSFRPSVLFLRASQLGHVVDVRRRVFREV